MAQVTTPDIWEGGYGFGRSVPDLTATLLGISRAAGACRRKGILPTLASGSITQQLHDINTGSENS